MSPTPNVLILLADQMRGEVIDPGGPCQTPVMDELAAGGVRFARSYASNAICSPARAGIMTGLLPHNHGVLTVTHTVDRDQCLLRTEHPHWAQRLTAAGYRTGYFGKWHVENTECPANFGWQVDGSLHQDLFKTRWREVHGDGPYEPEYTMARYYAGPEGYRNSLFYGVTTEGPETRSMGVTTQLALEFLEEATHGDGPWCCVASVREPHDPFVAGEEAYARYDVDALPLRPNVHDDLAGRPGVYRKSARTWADLTDRERRQAAACYYASVTEIDGQWARLIDCVEKAGQLDNTIVVVTADHGELLGSHGLYCKNFMASEEIYHVPLIVRGPGIAPGACTSARVGTHELCPTLLDLAGCDPISAPDSRSFAEVLRDPAAHEDAYETGYAEYFGGRYFVTQRVAWDGPWKFVLNGFDFDELYNLDEDPYELRNLAEAPAYTGRVREMMALVWRYARDTGDSTLVNSHYPALRIAPFGPGIVDS